MELSSKIVNGVVISGIISIGGLIFSLNNQMISMNKDVSGISSSVSRIEKNSISTKKEFEKSLSCKVDIDIYNKDLAYRDKVEEFKNEILDKRFMEIESHRGLIDGL